MFEAIKLYIWLKVPLLRISKDIYKMLDFFNCRLDVKKGRSIADSRRFLRLEVNAYSKRPYGLVFTDILTIELFCMDMFAARILRLVK